MTRKQKKVLWRIVISFLLLVAAALLPDQIYPAERWVIDFTGQWSPPAEWLETEVHEDAVEQVRSQLPQDEVLYDLAELFKIFGDSTRVKILYALLEAELCVCDIAKLMDVSQSAVSHQLRVLKGSKLVKFRREGKTLYYSLADEHVFRILSQGMEHILEGPETP